MSRAVLVDLTRCMGCRACQVACKAWNDNPGDPNLNCLGCYDNPPGFNANTWSLIQFNEVEYGGRLQWVFTKRQCMHCEHPGCVSVCTVGALEKTPEGPVIYHSDRCIGCRYCQYGCPYGVPSFEWDKALGLIRKCTFCTDRVEGAGLEPACVKACPTDALTFGTRDEMLAEAHRRINARPHKYYGKIYGEEEAGGASWLYISPVPFDLLRFPKLGEEPMDYASLPILNATPVTIVVAAAGLSGLYWLTKKKAEAEGKEE
jgi:formate dehydrogenase iron-sulfur subunit